ncbi:MAG: hypothetical protein AB1498_04450 [bacterium]
MFFILVLNLTLITLYFVGCGPKTEKFGEAVDENAPRTAIGSLLVNPQDYVNNEVIVEGQIGTECPTGGWVNIRDKDGAMIYIEMHGTPITIPQRVGRNVIVRGLVYQTEGEPKETKVLAKGLVIK